MEKLTECDCVDCGGDEPSHAVNCEYMVSEFGLLDRDMTAKPYSKDEERVVDYILHITDGTVGAGSDPIGFLIASHAFTQRERRRLVQENIVLKSIRDSFYFVAKWVERGLFDHHHTAKEALDVIAHYPGMPWKNGRWDVDHKPYASDFYKKFPKAKGEMEPSAA